MLENLEKMLAGEMNIEAEKMKAQIQSGVIDLLSKHKVPLLKVAIDDKESKSIVFELLDVRGSIVQSYGMYNFMIESTMASSNIVQRVQLQASLKVKQIKELVLSASNSAEQSIFSYLESIQAPDAPERFLLFGQTMGELRLFIFEHNPGKVGNQIREVSENEILNLFSFQKGGQDHSSEEE